MNVFESLFKYKPIVYQKGHLAFQLLGSPWLYIPFAIAAAIGAYYAYRYSVARETSGRLGW